MVTTQVIAEIQQVSRWLFFQIERRIFTIVDLRHKHFFSYRMKVKILTKAPSCTLTGYLLEVLQFCISPKPPKKSAVPQWVTIKSFWSHVSNELHRLKECCRKARRYGQVKTGK